MAKADRGSRSRSTRSIAVLGVALLVVAALVVGIVLGVRWWTQPDLFGNHGASSIVAPKKVKRAALHVAVTFPSADDREDVEVSFRDATAHFGANTAQAEATFWICRGESHIGTVRGRLEKHCPDAEPLERGSQMTYSADPNSDHVVVTLTPTRPGKARLDRVELDYSLGAGSLYRRGTESIDLDVTLQAR